MIDYNTINATLDEIIINEDNKRFGTTPYKFFLLVDGDDGKKYQVKLNEPGQRHNINEFIAHYMGSCSDMPLLDGVFLKFDDNEIKKLNDKLSSLPKDHLKPVDLSITKENLFFGIEWKQHITKINNEKELMQRVNDTSNSTSFYSLYSFDQYMKNYDRHIGNHLVTKDRNVKRYHLIDFDRIFASTNWSLVPTIKNDFSPLLSRPYHSFLMGLADDSTIWNILSYAKKIENIQPEEVKDMCDIIAQVYDVSDSEMQEISSWMIDRKGKLVLKCYNNEVHYPNVTQRGLYSAAP